ncbi:unnamed protein product [Paramecium octaurelia]|uniref:Leucine Rich Repeat family protein n=1 Tax=Paramecium octaurelia TaxID=43137 RepID=A0A8S1SM20_PAROT|nr:unnamed protein product [Paramecium octaurelia]
MSIILSNSKQQRKLPLLKDYTRQKKEMLKTFFTSKTSRSESRSKQNNEVFKEEKTYYFDESIKKQKNAIYLSQKLIRQTPRICPAKNELQMNQSEEISEDSSEKSKSSVDVFDLDKHKEHVKNKLNTNNDESYFGFLKNQQKLSDIAQHFIKEDGMNPIYYFCVHDSLFPKRIDLTNCLVDKKEMNFTNLGIGSKYYPILTTLLKQQKSQRIKQLYLSDNNLKDKELSLIIDCIPLSLKELKISNNKLGRAGALLLEKLFITHKSIKYLNVANNALGDAGAQILLNALMKNNTVTRLNLSENGLTDSISQILYNFLANNKAVEVFMLNWNYLGSLSGQLIAKGLANNKSLKVIDLSYNHLGQNNCMIYWSEIISNPKLPLIHIDLSYNQFSEQQLRILNEALKKNNQIYGLHIEGNKCPAYVDPNGFIQFANDGLQLQGNVLRLQQKKYEIDGVNFIPELNNGLIGSDCCWICQGWMEFKFNYTPEEFKGDVPIFLHLDFLDYKPIPMTSSLELKEQMKQQRKSKSVEPQLTTGEIIYQLKQVINEDKKITMAAIQEAYDIETKDEIVDERCLDDLDKFYYTTYQMCPPKRRILYFFSNPISEDYFIDKNSLSMSSPPDDLVLQGKDAKFQYHQFADGTKIKFKKVNQINYLLSKQEYVIDDKNDYKPLVKIFPRSAQKKYILRKFANNSIRKKVNIIFWNKEDSSFKQFQGDNDDLLDNCLDFDWSCSKITRFVRNEYERTKMKEYFRQQYQLLKDVYKYLSSFGHQPPQFDMFCIQFPQFSKLVQQLGLIDGVDLKIQDVESNLISIKNNVDNKYIYNPDSALIRYQFIESLYRLALDKYVRTNIVKNAADAVYRLLKEFKPYFHNFDSTQEWRQRRLWNKECDTLIQFKMGFLKKLYDYITDISNRRWYFKLKWISIKEFKEFCKQIGLNEYLSDKQQVIIYNFSMMSQVDELNQDRNVRMTLIEFIESLGRIAERISPSPIGERIADWTYEQRTMLPLNVKLESLLTYIYIKVNKKGAFESFNDVFGDEQQSKIQFMPTPESVLNDEEYSNTIETLTTYNTLSYLNLHKQPYLNPDYVHFLQNPVPNQPKFHGPLLVRRFSRADRKNK